MTYFIIYRCRDRYYTGQEIIMQTFKEFLLGKKLVPERKDCLTTSTGYQGFRTSAGLRRARVSPRNRLSISSKRWTRVMRIGETSR
jgi:hypothetical protein